MVTAAAILLALLPGPRQDAPTIEPKAKETFERMTAAYRNLKTLQCTVVRRDQQSRTRLYYRRPGRLLLQRLYPDQPGVAAEFRALGEKVIVSATENRKAYLRATLDRAIPWQSPFFDLENRSRAGLTEIGQFIEPGKLPFASQATTMRLGAVSKSADGTPVRTLIVGTKLVWSQGAQTVTRDQRITYEIGTTDSLARKISTETEASGGQSYRDTVEFENVIADRPIPESRFAFSPAKGMKAVAPISFSHVDPRAAAVVDATAKAVAALDSLSFTTEWNNQSISWGKSGKAHPTHDRVTIRFDLQRPLRARGEFLMEEMYAHQNMLVVSDGKEIFSRLGKEKDFVRQPVGEGQGIDRFGNRGIPLGAGNTAAWLVRAFFEKNPLFARAYFTNYRLATPRTVDGETLDVLEAQYRLTDEYGIPSDELSVERLLIRRRDHMPYAQERESRIIRFGKAYPVKTTERFVRLVPNPGLNPNLFTFDTEGGRSFSDEAAADAAAGRGTPDRALAGDTPASLPTRTLDGRAFSIADLKGKVVIVDAYTYGCRPCREHMLGHRRLVEKYAAQGLTTVGLILDGESDRATLERFVAEQKLTYPQLFDGQGWNGPAAKQFGIASVPFTVVIGRDGKVAYVEPADENLERIVVEQLKKRAP